MQYHEEDEFGIYKEEPARHSYGKLLTILILLLVSVIGVILFPRDSNSQTKPEVLLGTGLVCDTQEQIELFLSLEGGDENRLTRKNNKADGISCFILPAWYLRGEDVELIKDGDGKHYTITKILVFAIFDGKLVRYLSPPILQYTIFGVKGA